MYTADRFDYTRILSSRLDSKSRPPVNIAAGESLARFGATAFRDEGGFDDYRKLGFERIEEVFSVCWSA